jgi:hypothetical protein
MPFQASQCLTTSLPFSSPLSQVGGGTRFVARLCEGDNVQRVVQTTIPTAVQSVSFSSAGGSRYRRSSIGRSKSRLRWEPAHVTHFTKYSRGDDRADAADVHKRRVRLTYEVCNLPLQGFAFGIQCEESLDTATAEFSSAGLIGLDERLGREKGTPTGEHSAERALIPGIGNGHVGVKPIGDPGAFVEELVSVVHQELEILSHAGLAYRRQVRFAQNNPSDRQRVTRIRLSAST